MNNKKYIGGLLAVLMILGFMLLPKSVWADEGRWIQSQNRWWYENADGTYPASQWKLDNGSWYYFDKEGWMATGWQKVDGNWYYLASSGRMLTGWQKVGNNWYYMMSSGAMAADTWIETYYVDDSGAWIVGKTMDGTDSGSQVQEENKTQSKASWIKSQNRWWYRHADGSYTRSDWEKIDGLWYYFDGAGWMTTGWQKVGGNWYYMAGSGQRLTGWQKVSGVWYYMESSGKMLTGWQQLGGVWYYLASSGRMLTGWQQIGGSWYYLAASGAMAANTWIDGYYVNASGVWIPNTGNSGKKMIAIDAGHQRTGNSEKEPMGPGSSTMKAKVASGTTGIWSGLKEYELTLTVSLKLQAELQARGYDIYMIRTSHDVDISNAQRAKNAANAGADILVRIHANGDNNSSVSGALTMAPSGSNPFLSGGVISSSQKLSQNVVDSFCSATGARNRGVMTTDTMSGINWSTIPVTIVEMGFMTNQTEDLNMANASYQNKMAKGIADGIDRYFAG